VIQRQITDRDLQKIPGHPTQNIGERDARSGETIYSVNTNMLTEIRDIGLLPRLQFGEIT